MPDVVKVSGRVPRSVRASLDTLAAAQGISVGRLVGRLVTDYVHRADARQREGGR